jgi:hypothetical protein
MATVNKLVIGGREKIKLPGISRNKILARIDTGARSSTVHCEKYWLESHKGKKVLYAAVLNRHHLLKFVHFKIKRVKSSNGQTEQRFVVKLDLEIGEHLFEADFTLSNRKKMKNPVLLGRRFLRGHFVVDVSRNFILSGKKHNH